MKELGKYEILEEIGRGGFSTVYKARDPNLDQVVAIKVLESAHAARDDVVRRFLDEARRVVKLRHRGIVRLYAVDEDRGIPYIAMEYLPGGTLADRLSGEPLPLDGAIGIVEQVAAALDYAHKRELVHRDVKPANILFDDEGKAVLVDFGLVKSLAESGITIEGTSLGTPEYMAPEQADSTADVDARADVYALGVVAYQMLTGRVPFEADTPLTVLHAHAHESPPDPRVLNQTLDEGVAAAVLKALDKAPTERYQSAGAFARALRKAWQDVQDALQAEAALAELYSQVQEALKADQWGLAVSRCVDIRNIDPDYRDVSTLLTLAASRLAEEEERRQQERALGEQYEAALELLRESKHTEAIVSLEEIVAQAPGFRDVQEQLDRARTEAEKIRLYEAAVQKLADECPDEACSDLLALLELDPEHADARSQLLMAVEGLLMQVQQTQDELQQLRGLAEENETLRVRVAELEAQLEEAQATRDKLEAEASKHQIWLRTAQLGDKEDLLAALGAGDRQRARLRSFPLGPQPDWVAEDANFELLSGDDAQEGLWIDESPVTNADYARFVAETGHEPLEHWQGRTPPQEIADHPVTGITVPDAMAYAQWAAQRLPTEEVWERDGKEMVRVPAGKFLYGDLKRPRELPEFWIDKTPVTNAEYARFVTSEGQEPPRHWKGRVPPNTIADHPVTRVSWDDAIAYAKWAGKRLPTEEEWEKAARSTDGRTYPWGNSKPTPKLCNSGGAGTTSVGSYSPQGDSLYGCADMAGNVAEWTACDYEDLGKVLRGGSWRDGPDLVRSAARSSSLRSVRNNIIGFRCARDSQ